MGGLEAPLRLGLEDLARALDSGARLEGVQNLAGGVSADVYRLQLGYADGRSEDVVARVHGDSHFGHGAALEFALLQALYASDVPVPQPLMVHPAGVNRLTLPCLVMRFVAGQSELSSGSIDGSVAVMANMLQRIHATTLNPLPPLPDRLDPLPEVFDYLPDGDRWVALGAYLKTLRDTRYGGVPKLLHGDFWPQNLLWQRGEIVAVLDWEDAAMGDPLSDVAAAGLELRYQYGSKGMRLFLQAYAVRSPLDWRRLALWQIYVAAAAQHFMHSWGLPAAREKHMRRAAQATMSEAFAQLTRVPT